MDSNPITSSTDEHDDPHFYARACICMCSSCLILVEDEPDCICPECICHSIEENERNGYSY
jgi:hypothetical protein